MIQVSFTTQAPGTNGIFSACRFLRIQAEK